MSDEVDAPQIIGAVAKPILQTTGKIFQPRVAAASAWGTFQVFEKLVFLVAWLLCLPAELVLSRRIGKRYMPTLFFLVAFVGLIVVTQSLSRHELQAQRMSQRFMESRGPAVAQFEKMMAPFGCLMVATLAAFAGHYLANRRRFGTAEQGHSFEFGVPWYLYPPAAQAIGRLLQPTIGDFDAESERQHPRNLKELIVYPLSILLDLRRSLAIHVQRLANGEVPYGPFTWLVVSIVQPAALAAGGLVLAATSTNLAPFGHYLVVIGVAMFLKASIHRAQWRERSYDAEDSKLEAEALRQLHRGMPASVVSRAFTVPIAKAVVPPTVELRAEEPLAALPGFEHLMVSDQPGPDAEAPTV